MAKRLEGRVAIITGAAQGLGATYAKALAAEGAALVVSDVADAGPVARAIQDSGGRALALKNDVTSAASVQSMVADCVKAFGQVDILVTNAALFGTLKLKPFTEIDSAEWDRVMAVNVRGVFECAKAVAPEMRRRKYGKIVNIASGTVFKGTPMMMHYVSSKGAVVALTRCLARELGDDGIRVNTLAPGLVMSENVLASPDYPPAAVAGNTATRAIKKDLYPADLVGSMLYLCSADSDAVTGQVVVVDGGSYLH
jgi:NAD(P)-dependent dehydrogenase (short-subunit alcohol dehydrogenase family)